MTDLENKLKQCGKPTNDEGRALVEKMNESHFPLTSWGLEMINISDTDTILDIGCGGGRTISLLAKKTPKGKVFGIDHSPDCVKWSTEYNDPLIKAGQVDILQASVEKIPFKDNFFDLVTAVETIYFWPKIIENFREVRRILKPGGGFLIINEMYLSEAFRERNDKCMATERMTIYSPEQLKLLLKDSGFKNISINLIESKNWLRSLAFR